MSVYKKVGYKDLVESIDSILNQTYRTNDFIIVKDGPLTDEQNELIKKCQEHYDFFNVIELKENKGSGTAYNIAIDNCKNEYAAIMDSDDYADPTKFEKQISYLEKHPEIDIIGTNAVEFIGNKENIVSYRHMPETDSEIKKFAHGRCPLIQPTAIFKVEAVKKAGSYQHSPLTEDYDLYIRMIQNGCVFYTYQEILYYIRTSEDFFSRRGGIKYLKPILKFKRKHYKSGFYTFKEYAKTSMASLIVSLMPNKLRRCIYKKFLRK